MSDILYRDQTAPLISEADPSDFIALLKPRVMSLVVFTALVGLVAAPGAIHPFMAAVAILAIAIGGGAAGALNMWYDADIDRLMGRTAKRPIPAGKVTGDQALAFGLILSAFSVAMLGLATNWFAAGLLGFTIFFYAVVYTMWLKRWTAQNIVIGGAAGAFPPMVGWAAVTGGASIESFLLFLIIFIWTPPHFWALALVKSEDYGRAGVPMLPNVAGPDATRLQILLYTLLLIPTGISPVAIGLGGTLYGVVSAIGGLGMLWCAIEIFRKREGAVATKACWRMFGFSILYLFALFATLLIERKLLPLLGRVF